MVSHRRLHILLSLRPAVPPPQSNQVFAPSATDSAGCHILRYRIMHTFSDSSRIILVRPVWVRWKSCQQRRDGRCWYRQDTGCRSKTRESKVIRDDDIVRHSMEIMFLLLIQSIVRCQSLWFSWGIYFQRVFPRNGCKIWSIASSKAIYEYKVTLRWLGSFPQFPFYTLSISSAIMMIGRG